MRPHGGPAGRAHRALRRTPRGLVTVQRLTAAVRRYLHRVMRYDCFSRALRIASWAGECLALATLLLEFVPVLA